jgi:hypothetical protein
LPSAHEDGEIGDSSIGCPQFLYQHAEHEQSDADRYSVRLKIDRPFIQYGKIDAESLIQEDGSHQQRKPDESYFEEAHGHLRLVFTKAPSLVYAWLCRDATNFVASLAFTRMRMSYFLWARASVSALHISAVFETTLPPALKVTSPLWKPFSAAGLSSSIAHDHPALDYHFDPSPFSKNGATHRNVA